MSSLACTFRNRLPVILQKQQKKSKPEKPQRKPSKSIKWEAPLSMFKSVGPKLVPFFKTVGMYFVIFVPSDRPSWFATLIKCLPVASLALFVLLHGISMGKQHSFARKILTGLIFSCLGDALLIWPDYFLHGMVSFGLAQICYILAFGFEPENYTVGVVIYGLTSVGLGLIMPGLMLSDGSLVVGVPIYILLLTTMAWRAMARVQYFEDLLTWTKVCSSLGGILFVASDTVLGLNKFFVEVPHAQAATMITYYLAQLGIALSVVNAHKGAPRPSPDGYEYMNDIDGDQGPYGRQGGKTRGRNVTWQKSLPTSVPTFDSEDEEDMIPFSSSH